VITRRSLTNGNLPSRHAVRPTASNGVATNAHTSTSTLTFTVASAENLRGRPTRLASRKLGLRTTSAPLIQIPGPKFGCAIGAPLPTGPTAISAQPVSARGFQPQLAERLMSITKGQGCLGSNVARLEFIGSGFCHDDIRQTGRRTNSGGRKTAKCRRGVALSVPPRTMPGTSAVKLVSRHNNNSFGADTRLIPSL